MKNIYKSYIKREKEEENIDRLVRDEHINVDTKIKAYMARPVGRGEQKIIIKAIDIVNTFVL